MRYYIAKLVDFITTFMWAFVINDFLYLHSRNVFRVSVGLNIAIYSYHLVKTRPKIGLSYNTIYEIAFAPFITWFYCLLSYAPLWIERLLIETFKLRFGISWLIMRIICREIREKFGCESDLWVMTWPRFSPKLAVFVPCEVDEEKVVGIVKKHTKLKENQIIVFTRG